MANPQLYLKQIIPLVIICFISCGDVRPNLAGIYSYKNEDADSSFIEITQDSVLIYTSYQHSNSYNVVHIAIGKLRFQNDTLYAKGNSSLEDSLYCDKVVDYAHEQNLFKPGVDLGCIAGFDVYFTEFTKSSIKLAGRGGKPQVLRRIK
ncbi:MAG: hypothetical protein AB7G44_13610 [Bacteroidia bacterium]